MGLRTALAIVAMTAVQWTIAWVRNAEFQLWRSLGIAALIALGTALVSQRAGPPRGAQGLRTLTALAIATLPWLLLSSIASTLGLVVVMFGAAAASAAFFVVTRPRTNE